MKEDIYKKFEVGDKYEVKVEDNYGRVLLDLSIWDGYAKADHIQGLKIKVYHKEEGKRKERLI